MRSLEGVADRIAKMSREEFLESLRRAGIIDENNKLMACYKRGKDDDDGQTHAETA